ncbi:oligopeptide transport system permease protein [Marininema mesophilum]|uniref:Oligopeptide transport system permease protein n=1 Tax=Marininema mesophilum TaxID=1048340 RepID=A0A1H2ZUB4_9BACL|nr:ABC transporter permease [Marininema mesophilum]SDX20926.1 oligopeptide transport system permease protein [Marininema mesophilum]
MGRFALQRFMYMVITLWVIITLTFFLMHTMPGSPLQHEDKLPPELKEEILKEYGLDKPLPVQYVTFLGKLAQADLGSSFKYDGRSVTDLIMQGFPASLQLGIQATIIGVIFGIILGCVSALRRGTWVDNVANVFSILGYSVPNFVLATLLSYYVGVKLQWLPPAKWDGPEYSILPTLSLAVLVMATIARYIRTEMLEVLGQDYMKTAKAKGLSARTAIIKHALRNALIPAVTVLGPLIIGLITGSLVVEQIFAIPGMGWMFVDSIQVNDYTVIMGITIFYSALIIVGMFLVDVLYGIIDPRIRIGGVQE